jgi:hypothetical protein
MAQPWDPEVKWAGWEGAFEGRPPPREEAVSEGESAPSPDDGVPAAAAAKAPFFLWTGLKR